MPATPKSPLRRGLTAPGNTQFVGQGFVRSCGKCLEHRPPGGGRRMPVYGWVCGDCVDSINARKKQQT